MSERRAHEAQLERRGLARRAAPSGPPQRRSSTTQGASAAVARAANPTLRRGPFVEARGRGRCVFAESPTGYRRNETRRPPLVEHWAPRPSPSAAPPLGRPPSNVDAAALQLHEATGGAMTIQGRDEKYRRHDENLESRATAIRRRDEKWITLAHRRERRDRQRAAERTVRSNIHPIAPTIREIRAKSFVDVAQEPYRMDQRTTVLAKAQADRNIVTKSPMALTACHTASVVVSTWSRHAFLCLHPVYSLFPSNTRAAPRLVRREPAPCRPSPWSPTRRDPAHRCTVSRCTVSRCTVSFGRGTSRLRALGSPGFDRFFAAARVRLGLGSQSGRYTRRRSGVGARRRLAPARGV